MNNVFTKIYKAPSINRNEILRYAGVGGRAEEVEELLEKCLKEAVDAFTYKVCYGEYDIEIRNGIIDLGFTQISSKNLEKNLSGCSSIVLFAATVGLTIDRLIAKNASTSPVKALIFQAIGTERIESLCNLFNNDIIEEKEKTGCLTCKRYSPGYGDFPLEIQKDIVSILDCQRKVGITLTDGLLMTPSKSVTAIIGVKKKA